MNPIVKLTYIVKMRNKDKLLPSSTIKLLVSSVVKTFEFVEKYRNE